MATHREAFITIGATASFRPLIETCFSPPFLSTLVALEYTHLTIQCGADLRYAISEAESAGKRLHKREPRQTSQSQGQERSHSSKLWEISGLKTRLFGFNKEGLGNDMQNCKAAEPGTRGALEGRREGVVVSHAGAGTILDAMRLDLPTIVVPNSSLMDNHQAELAEELERQGYVIHGQLNDLPFALLASEAKLRSRISWQRADTPATSELSSRGIVTVLDAEVGYEMHTRETLD